MLKLLGFMLFLSPVAQASCDFTSWVGTYSQTYDDSSAQKANAGSGEQVEWFVNQHQAKITHSWTDSYSASAGPTDQLEKSFGLVVNATTCKLYLTQFEEKLSSFRSFENPILFSEAQVHTTHRAHSVIFYTVSSVDAGTLRLTDSSGKSIFLMKTISEN
jgi:hypothetical protein